MNDQIVLVTGGAGNLGRAVSRRLLEEGARVVVPFYKTDKPTALDRLKADFGDRIFSFALDLTTERGSEQAIRQVVEWAGSLTSVVHLVGAYSGGSKIADTPLEIWTRMVDLNLTSAYLISRFAIPQLVKGGGGSLVFVSARAALSGGGGRAAYAATKAGLLSFAHSLADEYGDSGIRSNVLVPDTIDTEDNRRAMPDADFTAWIKTEDVADLVVKIVSGKTDASNGASIPLFEAN